jgi:hypothetical protein
MFRSLQICFFIKEFIQITTFQAINFTTILNSWIKMFFWLIISTASPQLELSGHKDMMKAIFISVEL